MDVIAEPQNYTFKRVKQGDFYNGVDEIIVPRFMVVDSYVPHEWAAKISALQFFDVVSLDPFEKEPNSEKTENLRGKLIASAPRFACTNSRMSNASLLQKIADGSSIKYKAFEDELVEAQPGDYFLKTNAVMLYLRRLGVRYVREVMNGHNLGYFAVDKKSISKKTSKKGSGIRNFALTNTKVYTLAEVNAFFNSLT